MPMLRRACMLLEERSIRRICLSFVSAGFCRCLINRSQIILNLMMITVRGDEVLAKTAPT